MTKSQVQEVLERVLAWPEERQKDAMEMLTEMELQDKSPYQLTDEQAEEVRKRIDDPDPKFMTLEEVRERFAARKA